MRKSRNILLLASADGPTGVTGPIGTAGMEVLVAIAAGQVLSLPLQSGDPLPSEIVWMPKGQHQISCAAADGKSWKGTVICDEAGARAVSAMLAAVLASGRRVFLDKDHDDGAATAWVTAFSWDPSQGIMAKVQWTSLGDELLRGKVYHSFSPAFLLNPETKRVSGFPAGHSAGGLVNSPAFGSAMPSLIAARLAGLESTQQPASGGFPDKTNKAMNALLIKLLAALKVEVPASATEEQLVALATKHIDGLPANLAGAEATQLKAILGELQSLKAKDGELVALKAKEQELESLKAKEAQRRKDDAKAQVDMAIARGAIPPKDEALQAKWLGIIEADPSHAELLKALPENPALRRVTEPGIHIQVEAKLVENLRAYAAEKDSKKAGAIYARYIDAEIGKLGNELLRLMAANSLGNTSSAIILQRYLSLLKFRFPFLKNLTTDFTADGAKFGQQIITRLRSVPTVRDYDATTGYTTRSDAVTADVTITMNKHKYAAIEFKSTELASTGRDLFGEQSEPQLYAIGYQFVTDLLSLIAEGASAFGTAGSQATEIANAAAFNAATLDTAAAALDGRQVSPMGRFSLLDSSLWRNLRGDTRLVYAAGFQDLGLIKNYDMMMEVSGFQPYNAPFMPSGVVVDTSKALHGFCGTSESLAVATRLPSDYTEVLPGIGGVNIRTITDPDSQLSMMLVQYLNNDLGSAIQRVALMYGAAIGNPKTGQLIAY